MARSGRRHNGTAFVIRHPKELVLITLTDIPPLCDELIRRIMLRLQDAVIRVGTNVCLRTRRAVATPLAEDAVVSPRRR